MTTQEPYQGFNIGAQEFADNPDPRVPCVLLVDTSGSMEGLAIGELNAGIRQYRNELLTDNIAARRVELAIITFGGEVSVRQEFTNAHDFTPPLLEARGTTPMAEAVKQGVLLIEQRKATYQRNGVSYYRPWIFLITDGEPTDPAADWQAACAAVRFGEDQKKFTFFAVGTGQANFARLAEISVGRPPLHMKGIAFRELFRWLSNSQTRMSQSQVGAALALPPATGDGGWATVPT